MLKKIALSLLLCSSLLADAVQDLVDSNSDFAFSAYKEMPKMTPNVLFSPYSIFTCLSMVYTGAAGNTAIQMQQALHLTLSKKDLLDASSSLSKKLQNPAFSIANGLWLNKNTNVLASFQNAIQQSFQANLQLLDFSKPDDALVAINTWTSEKTKGKIPDLLQKNDIDANTRLVLTNALYFSSQWLVPFAKDNTKKAPFFPKAGSSVDVSMMNQTGFFPYFENGLMQLLALPFKTKEGTKADTVCLIMLPKDPYDPFLEKALTTTSIQEWIDSLDQEQVAIALPKFTLSQRVDLNELLKKLGMQIPFSPGADFSGINGARDLFLNRVVHQAFFALDEAGVTAAAATAASINVTAAPSDNLKVFTADKPFLFFLVDLPTKSLLFMGKLTKP